jgi:ribosomal protein S12 methylthiotransferase accessory factor
LQLSAVVVLIGEGLLANFVRDHLEGKYRLVCRSDLSEELPAADLALLLHDGWQPSAARMAEQRFRESGTPWLRGFVMFGEGIIGPLVRPDSPGCSYCADMRRLAAGSDRREIWELQHNSGAQRETPRDVWASRSAMFQMGGLIAAEVQRVLDGGSALTEARMFLFNLKTMAGTRHFFLPDPLCPFCGGLPDDSPSAARLLLRPNPKIGAGSYRIRPLHALQDVLAADYLDYRTGFLNGKMRDLVSPFADASVNLPLLSGDEVTAGRTHCYADSEMTAILEGLERYCGMAPRGKRTTVRGSFRQLEQQAMNPVSVGLYTEEQYARPGFPFQPFDPDRSMDWVWGYSLLQERPILVPELLAYYSMGFGNGFVHETSNGCALGGSLEEAVFYGLLEVVERDSFLLTWYAQLSAPRLDPYSAADNELALMTERLREVAGYELHLYNTTMEHGIPSVWAMAKNGRTKGVNVICAAGAHPDPVRAVKSAVHEVAGMLQSLDEKFEAHRDAYTSMLHDPFLVRHMEDHSMLYGLPQAEARLHFLLDESRPLQTFRESFGRQASASGHDDLTEDLKDIVQKFRQLKLDVIVVDQTTPETLRNGLHCVKVLIPGMLPMTFGHHLTRFAGLERVLTVPVELGYAKRPLKLEQLNPYPHPFP